MTTPPRGWNARAKQALNTHLWLILSLAFNFFLVLMLYIATDPWRPPEVPTPASGSGAVIKTNVLVLHENFTWEQVESTNYVTFIKNLRAVGCPEPTIRDIIVSEVDRLFARRRLDEVNYPNYQWWRSEPDPAVVQAATAKLEALDAERLGILVSLLGHGWDVQDNEQIAARAGITLTGPILGDLPPESKISVYAMIAHAQLKIEAYEESQRAQNRPADPMELVRLRDELIGSLVADLSPPQYEEFVLRYSPSAQQLREELRVMTLTPEQFRDIFSAVSSLNGQPVFYYAGTDPTLLAQRQQLHAQENEAIKEAIGDQAYAAYQLSQDPVYRSSKAMVEQLGIPDTAVSTIYQINRATQTEVDRIRKDDTMNADEKVEAISQTQVEQQQSLQELLGPEVFQRWLTNSAYH